MRKPTRREFAAAAASLPFFASTASAQVPPPSTPAEPPVEAPSPALAAAMAAALKAQYGEHLSDAELRKLEGNIAESLPWLERMREFPLANSDEPDFVFMAEDPR